MHMEALHRLEARLMDNSADQTQFTPCSLWKVTRPHDGTQLIYRVITVQMRAMCVNGVRFAQLLCMERALLCTMVFNLFVPAQL